jgi:ferredoxin
MRVVLDPERCTGHGRCYSLAPTVYDADDSGHCVVVVAEVSGAAEDEARTGVENCPERALRLED